MAFQFTCDACQRPLEGSDWRGIKALHTMECLDACVAGPLICTCGLDKKPVPLLLTCPSCGERHYDEEARLDALRALRALVNYSALPAASEVIESAPSSGKADDALRTAAIRAEEREACERVCRERETAPTPSAAPPITHVAVRVDGQVWSLPRPFRHHHIIRTIARLTGAKFVDCSESRGDQGFLDATGRYLTRKEALPIALANKQVIDENDIRCEMLFSEDVWRDRDPCPDPEPQATDSSCQAECSHDHKTMHSGTVQWCKDCGALRSYNTLPGRWDSPKGAKP
jgi:hypothetical protein